MYMRTRARQPQRFVIIEKKIGSTRLPLLCSYCRSFENVQFTIHVYYNALHWIVRIGTAGKSISLYSRKFPLTNQQRELDA